MKIVKLMFKNLFRHKLRTFLTIMGIAVAVMAFGLLRTIVTAWSAGVEASSTKRMIAGSHQGARLRLCDRTGRLL